MTSKKKVEIVVINKYRTSDGRIFDKRKDAEKYEGYRKLEKLVKNHFSDICDIFRLPYIDEEELRKRVKEEVISEGTFSESEIEDEVADRVELELDNNEFGNDLFTLVKGMFGEDCADDISSHVQNEEEFTEFLAHMLTYSKELRKLFDLLKL